MFQWDTHLTSLWGLGNVQCVPVGHPLTSLWGLGGVQRVPVGHPLDQAGWDQLALSGSQFAWLFFFFFLFFF